MASATPLLTDSPSKVARSKTFGLGRWANFLSSALNGKDGLTVAVEKSVATQKEKHINFLLEQLEDNPALMEDVLLRYSALTRWDEDFVIACRVLSCIHLYITRIPSTISHRADCITVFLNEMRNTWSLRQGLFIEQYAAALVHHVLTAKQHYQLYSNTFSRGLAATVPLTIAFFESEELLLYLSKLLSYQDRLLSLLAFPYLPQLLEEAKHTASLFIIEQCKMLLAVIRFLTLHLDSPTSGDNNKDEDRIDVSILKDQMDAQEQLLRRFEREL